MADYVKYNAPAIATITNLLSADDKANWAYDPGSLQRGTVLKDDEDRPYVVKHLDRRIQFYRVNSYAVLSAGDEIKIAIESSEEACYYSSLAVEGEISVAIAEPEE